VTHLEVWGDPIAHSRSPLLHGTAYALLGLDWTYDRRRVSVGTFDAEIAASDVRGLSVTMPLKESAHRIAVRRDRRAELTGAVNTLRFGVDDGPHGFNTDVGGFVRALADTGVTAVERGRIVGAGATSASALVAMSELGASSVEIVARTPAKAVGLFALADELGLKATVTQFGDELGRADLTIATLPGGVELGDDVARIAEDGGILFDAAYAPWPTALATAWASTGRTASDGLGMLLHQAVLQVRVFVTGDVIDAFDDEDVMIAAMRVAVMGD